MKLARSADEVLQAIQDIKSRAGTAFSTNFFPVRPKMDSWIEHQELLIERRAGAAFFFRRDRDFLHVYFAAESASALETEAARLSALQDGKLTLDLVGAESAISAPRQSLSAAGFRGYATLIRLARMPQMGSSEAVESQEVATLHHGDALEILNLLETFFDPYADQIPLRYEIESAIEAGQIIAIKKENKIAAFIHFETQGVTSTIRYWMAAEAFREQGLGGVLLRHYFAIHSAARRFTLWVNAANKNALKKYERFGYAPDGLTDHVLINQKIAA
jgi:RimJ/RimL family protein N-acetyltransferase